MTDQVASAATGTTVIAARSGGVIPIEPARSGTGAASGPFHLRTGRYGEDLAATYLEDIGWTILERNWRPDHGLRGELDIIALEPFRGCRESDGQPIRLIREQQGSMRPTLVIVEVKTRSSLRQGPPAAAVDARKLARLRALAAAWASIHETAHAGLRLDVVSILLRDSRPALLRHHRAVGTSWG